jgi:hypothetical protein
VLAKLHGRAMSLFYSGARVDLGERRAKSVIDVLFHGRGR